jgi:putative membrane protein
MNLIIRWLLATVAVILVSYLLPGISLAGFWTALLVALVLGIINAVIKPFLIILTLPINIMTLGLFTLVINALLVLLASAVVSGFGVNNFWTAVLFSILLSIVNFFLSKLAPSKD